MSKPRQTLSVDLDELFPGGTVTIGTQVIIIKPLGLESLSNMYKLVKGWSSLLEKEGITFENFNHYENILKISVIVIENAPEVLEEAANLALEDIKKLPLEVIVELVSEVIAVNVKSKDDLVKNFKSLMEILFPKTETEPEPEPEKTPETEITEK